MEDRKEKIIGYCLLTLGLLIIFFSFFRVYNVLTGKSKPSQLFNASSVSLNLGSLMPNLPQNNNLPSSPVLPGGALPNLDFLSKGTINDILNLSTEFFLMTFILGVGYKIASLGVMLIRPPVVKYKLKQEENRQTPQNIQQS